MHRTVPSANMSSPTLEAVFLANEAFRATVGPDSAGWITEREMKGSVFNYGVMSTGKIDVHEKVQTKQSGSAAATLRKLLLPVGPHPTEHDLVSWLAERLRPASGASLEYLEIGVSVLKAFETQAAYLRNASGSQYVDIVLADDYWTAETLITSEGTLSPSAMLRLDATSHEPAGWNAIARPWVAQVALALG